MEKIFRQNVLKAITFSYDDGVTQDIHLIELLNKYGLKATFNLCSGLLGRPGLASRSGRRTARYKVAPEQVREVYAGHEVAVHTLTHPHIASLPPDEILRQVEEDRLALEGLVGYPVVGMAYPYGESAGVAELLRDRTPIRYARTIERADSFALQEDLLHLRPTAFHLEFDRLDALADEFLAMEPTSPQVFYIWGHAYELDEDSDYWPRLERFFSRIAGREDVFYGTNREVLLGEIAP